MKNNRAKAPRMAQERRKPLDGPRQGGGVESQGGGQGGGNPATLGAGEQPKKLVWVVRIRPLEVRGKVYRRPPSLNRKTHWGTKSSIVKAFRDDAYMAAKEARIPKLPAARITIHDFSHAPLDRDNLTGAMKAIVDGLALAFLPTKMTKRGAVALDDEEHLDLRCRSFKRAHTEPESLIAFVEPTTPEQLEADRLEAAVIGEFIDGLPPVVD